VRVCTGYYDTYVDQSGVTRKLYLAAGTHVSSIDEIVPLNPFDLINPSDPDIVLILEDYG
jgi:hypothetical protein